MSNETELRQELAEERRELKEAVGTLRAELLQTGKKVGTAMGAAAGAALVSRVLFGRRRKKR